jgi:hypothetical protein
VVPHPICSMSHTAAINSQAAGLLTLVSWSNLWGAAACPVLPADCFVRSISMDSPRILPGTAVTC